MIVFRKTGQDCLLAFYCFGVIPLLEIRFFYSASPSKIHGEDFIILGWLSSRAHPIVGSTILPSLPIYSLE